MNKRWNRIPLGAEFVVLFFGVPLFMFLDTGFTLPSAVLLPSLVVIFLILHFRTDFKWRELLVLKIPRKQVIRDGFILMACAILLILSVLLWIPDKLFNLPRANLWIWLALCTFYPVFSAYPQEILFRIFIFRRYKKLFLRNWLLVAASGISFSFAHILYYHPVSMILTLIAGIYLARVYSRTGSVLYTAILHGILGMFVYTLGLGEYFWLEMYEYFPG